MTDTDYMHIAMGVAYGSFDPSSNKHVGCIIVKNGVIVGSGKREVFIFKIKPYKDICIHAEHEAIIEAGIMTKRSTMYCTMEPCTWRNKDDTNAIVAPKSCCELILEAEIERVVYSIKDGYVGGGGKEFLEQNGIKVEQILI